MDNWEVLYVPKNSPKQKFRCYLNDRKLYTAMIFEHCERLFVISVWLPNEKIIPLFCYNVPVSAVFYKFNRHYSLQIGSAVKINSVTLPRLFTSWTSLKDRQSALVSRMSALEGFDFWLSALFSGHSHELRNTRMIHTETVHPLYNSQNRRIHMGKPMWL